MACTPSLTFWVVAMLGWIVWALAVSTADDTRGGIEMVAISVSEATSADNAAEDNHWFENVGVFSAADGLLIDGCDDDELTTNFCALYIIFTAWQLVAVSMASASMFLFMVAVFRPAAGGYCSARTLGTAAGMLMALFALFQLLTCLVVVVIEKNEKDFGGSTAFIENPELGLTFAVAVAAVVLAVLQAGLVLVFARASGDGPLYKYVYNCIGMRTRSRPVRGGSMPQPPRPICLTPARVVSPASMLPVISPPSDHQIPGPELYSHVAAQTIPSEVAGGAVQPVLANTVIEPPVASPAVHPVIPKQTAQSPVATQAVDPPEINAPSVQLQVEGPTVEQVESSQGVNHSVGEPVLESIVASHDVQSPAGSCAAVSPAGTPVG